MTHSSIFFSLQNSSYTSASLGRRVYSLRERSTRGFQVLCLILKARYPHVLNMELPNITISSSDFMSGEKLNSLLGIAQPRSMDEEEPQQQQQQQEQQNQQQLEAVMPMQQQQLGQQQPQGQMMVDTSSVGMAASPSPMSVGSNSSSTSRQGGMGRREPRTNSVSRTVSRLAISAVVCLIEWLEAVIVCCGGKKVFGALFNNFCLKFG